MKAERSRLRDQDRCARRQKFGSERKAVPPAQMTIIDFERVTLGLAARPFLNCQFLPALAGSSQDKVRDVAAMTREFSILPNELARAEEDNPSPLLVGLQESRREVATPPGGFAIVMPPTPIAELPRPCIQR